MVGGLFGLLKRQAVCPHCGWEIAADAIRCDTCGNPIDADLKRAAGGCRYCKVIGAVFVLVLLAGVVALLLRAASF